MLKYNVGDKVRVRSDLKVGLRYGSMSFLEGMSHLRGKVATIEDCTPCSYKVAEDDYEFWTDEMFEGLAEEATPRKFKVPSFPALSILP